MTTMPTYMIIRRLRRSGCTTSQIRQRARSVAALGTLACQQCVVTQDEADAIAPSVPDWPTCWCGCERPASAWESDGSSPAHEHCVEYACDDDGQPVCGCDPRVEDHGEWTGGGMHGSGTGWVSRLRVAREDR